jgi:hypothetical protein
MEVTAARVVPVQEAFAEPLALAEVAVQVYEVEGERPVAAI